METLEQHTNGLQKLVQNDCRNAYRTRQQLSNANSASSEHYSALAAAGFVYASFNRTPRVEDFKTLPRNQLRTTVFETIFGEKIELDANTDILILCAPYISERSTSYMLKELVENRQFTTEFDSVMGFPMISFSEEGKTSV